MKYIKAEGGIKGVIINDKFHLEVTSVDDFWAMTADRIFKAKSNIKSVSIDKMDILDDLPYLFLYEDYFLYFNGYIPENFKKGNVITNEGIMSFSRLEAEFPEILF